jgi:hypothetical protein
LNTSHESHCCPCHSLHTHTHSNIHCCTSEPCSDLPRISLDVPQSTRNVFTQWSRALARPSTLDRPPSCHGSPLEHMHVWQSGQRLSLCMSSNLIVLPRACNTSSELHLQRHRTTGSTGWRCLLYARNMHCIIMTKMGAQKVLHMHCRRIPHTSVHFFQLSFPLAGMVCVDSGLFECMMSLMRSRCKTHSP